LEKKELKLLTTCPSKWMLRKKRTIEKYYKSLDWMPSISEITNTTGIEKLDRNM
jgi:hypothetical protein